MKEIQAYECSCGKIHRTTAKIQTCEESHCDHSKYTYIYTTNHENSSACLIRVCYGCGHKYSKYFFKGRLYNFLKDLFDSVTFPKKTLPKEEKPQDYGIMCEKADHAWLCCVINGHSQKACGCFKDDMSVEERYCLFRLGRECKRSTALIEKARSLCDNQIETRLERENPL